MNEILRHSKRVIRGYLQTQYSDTNLTEILDHARSGGLAHYSCCCVAGLPFRQHAGLSGIETMLNHEPLYLDVLNGAAVSLAFSWLAGAEVIPDPDALRRLRIIPMVLAEIRRRNRMLPELRDCAVAEPVEVAL